MFRKSEEILNVHVYDPGGLLKKSKNARYTEKPPLKCLNINYFKGRVGAWLHHKVIYSPNNTGIKNGGCCRYYMSKPYDAGVYGHYALGGLYYDFVKIMSILDEEVFYD